MPVKQKHDCWVFFVVFLWHDSLAVTGGGNVGECSRFWLLGTQ